MIASSALTELRSIFHSLCADSSTLVRREAAKALPVCYSAFGSRELSPCVKQLEAFIADDVCLSRSLNHRSPSASPRFQPFPFF